MNCPVCEERRVTTCKCARFVKHDMDSLERGHGNMCKNGHRWTTDTETGKVIYLDTGVKLNDDGTIMKESRKFPVEDESSIGRKNVPLDASDFIDAKEDLNESKKEKKSKKFKDYNQFFWADVKNPPENVIQPQKNDTGYEMVKRSFDRKKKRFDTGYFSE